MTESATGAPQAPARQASAREAAVCLERPVPVAGPAGGMPFAMAVVLAVAGGASLSLAFPSRGWWVLAPVSVAGIVLATRGRRARGGALLGFLAGLAFFVPHLSWSGIYVGELPWFALASLEAIFFAVLGAVLPLAWRAPGGRAGMVLTVAGLWVAQEALRGRLPFGGFPWGRLAFSQVDAPTAALAWLGGAPAVSAAVAAAGGLLAVAAAALTSRTGTGRREPAARLAGVVVPVALAVAVMAAGLLVPLDADGARQVQVAAVQGDVPKPGLDFNDERRAVLDNHAAATIAYASGADARAAPAPELVLWPENASDIDPLRNPDATAVIQRAVDAAAVPVLVGAVLREPAEHLSNAAIVWGPSGSAEPGPGERYVKRRPAPFGEYIPYRSLFRMLSDKVDLVRRDFVAGDEVGALRVGPARVGVVICFEVAYDDLVRDSVRAGADLVVVQTNNATFGVSDESVQQLAMSRLRAVETGRSVVHISTVGISALITPDGAVVARSGHFTQEVLAASLPLDTGLTPAVHVGAWLEWTLAAMGVGLALAAFVAGRRRGGGM